MENLSFDTILDDENFELGIENDKSGSHENDDSEFDNENDVTEVDELEFDDEPESVSDDEDTSEREDADSKNQGTSPITFSSIAKAFAEEGVFPDLEDDDINGVKSAGDFVDLVKKQVQAQLDETQKRINDALNAGVESSEIRNYEGVLGYLNSITESQISAEGEEGQNLRQRLIYQDFLNRGISKDRAAKLTQRAVENGTDIEDAKEAFSSNVEYYKKQYNDLIASAQEASKQEKAEQEKQAAALKKSILEDDKLFGDLQIDKATRQKIYHNVSAPVYKDKETGRMYTVIQKYEMEHPNEFLKNISMVYTLTDGFTKIDKLLGKKVKKEVSKGLQALEHTLNNTARTSDGRLDFLSGLRDPEANSHTKFDLDI